DLEAHRLHAAPLTRRRAAKPPAGAGALPETAVRGGGGAVSASIRRRRQGCLDRRRARRLIGAPTAPPPPRCAIRPRTRAARLSPALRAQAGDGLSSLLEEIEERAPRTGQHEVALDEGHRHPHARPRRPDRLGDAAEGGLAIDQRASLVARTGRVGAAACERNRIAHRTTPLSTSATSSRGCAMIRSRRAAALSGRRARRARRAPPRRRGTRAWR